MGERRQAELGGGGIVPIPFVDASGRHDEQLACSEAGEEDEEGSVSGTGARLRPSAELTCFERPEQGLHGEVVELQRLDAAAVREEEERRVALEDEAEQGVALVLHVVLLRFPAVKEVRPVKGEQLRGDPTDELAVSERSQRLLGSCIDSRLSNSVGGFGTNGAAGPRGRAHDSELVSVELVLADRDRDRCRIVVRTALHAATARRCAVDTQGETAFQIDEGR